MRQRYTFLVTVLYDEGEPDALRGRLRSVKSDHEATFTNEDELMRCLWLMLQRPLPLADESALPDGPRLIG